MGGLHAECFGFSAGLDLAETGLAQALKIYCSMAFMDNRVMLFDPCRRETWLKPRRLGQRRDRRVHVA